MSRFLWVLEQEIKRQNANVFAIAEYHGEPSSLRHAGDYAGRVASMQLAGDYTGRVASLQLAETNPCQDVYSVAKVYVVTAIGMLVDRGLLSTDEFLTDILGSDCPSGYASIWDRTTVDMLLLHKVGLPKNFLDIDTFNAAWFGEDYLAYIMREPIVGVAAGIEASPTCGEDPDVVREKCHDPRKRAAGALIEPCYTDAAYYLLARIVEKRAGMGLDNFLWKHLFYPTGCREAAWSHCPQGHVIGATGLYLRVEEMVKLGAIYLNGGTWNNKRILSREWVDTVLAKGYELKPLAGSRVSGYGRNSQDFPADGCGRNPQTNFPVDDCGQKPQKNGCADGNGQNPQKNGCANGNGQKSQKNGCADGNGQNPQKNGCASSSGQTGQTGALVYGKGGMRGQMLMILPAQKRVVAYLGYGGHSLVEFVGKYKE